MNDEWGKEPEIKLTGAQKRIVKQMKREKPPQPTILKRSTARSLNYLTDHRLMKEPILASDKNRFAIPKSSLRRLGDGMLVRDLTASHGV